MKVYQVYGPDGYVASYDNFEDAHERAERLSASSAKAKERWEKRRHITVEYQEWYGDSLADCFGVFRMSRWRGLVYIENYRVHERYVP